MKRRFVASAPLLLMGLLSVTSAQAQSPALDQANEPYNLYSVQLYTGAVPGGQTFTAGMDGELSRASVYVQKQCLPDCPDMLLQLRSLSGQVLASATVSQAQIPQGSYNWIDVTFSTPALVAAGTQYALVMQNAQPNLSGGYDWRYEVDSSVDSYPAGMLFQVGYSSHPDSDLYFRTYVSLPTLPANLALGKPTSQSSTGWNGAPARAVDGNTDGAYWNGSVTHTNEEFQPWWQVDLQNSQGISTVVLYNRTDCCSDRLQNFRVRVSDDAVTWQDYPFTGVAPTQSTFTINRSARYVRVQLDGTNALSLAEVKVFPVVPNDYYVNAATGLDTNPGTQALPWKTITHAIHSAAAGPANIYVAPGTYSDGETFPIAPRASQNLIGDIANKGNGPTPTRISGGATFHCSGGDLANSGWSAAVGLESASNNSSIQGFSIIDPNFGGMSVWVCNTTATVANNTVFGPSSAGVVAGFGANVTLTSNVIQGSWAALFYDSGTRVKARGNTFSATNQYAIALGYQTWFTGSGIDLGTAADPGGNTILGTGNGVGLRFYAPTDSVVQAVGNTWKANVQGADAQGKYSPQLITTTVSETLGNNYATVVVAPGAGLQL